MFMKKIKVNDDMCIGCGYCCARSDVFDMNDETGRAFAKDNNLDEMDESKKEKLLETKEGCPVGAIEVEEN